jgi:probable O-glycosylation ligase (exosortase A-associated)
VTLLGFHASRPTRWFLRDVRCFVMIGMGIWVCFSLLYSGHFEGYQLSKLVEYLKILAVALFTTAVIRRPEQLRVLVWCIALSLGFYGFKGGVSGVLGGMHGEVLRGPGGMLADNNDFGLALVMSVPLLLHIGLTEANKVLQRGVLLMVPLTIVTIVLTHSRGAFLALSAVFLVLVWRSRNRVAGFAVGALAVAAVAVVAPRSYYERIAQIKNYEQDGSAMGRLAAWKTAINMSKANPVFGVGLNMFASNYDRYSGGEPGRVAHNSYLQMLAEAGAPVLGLYLLNILLSLWGLARIRRMAQRHYFTSWIVGYATMFEASLVGFIVGSTFLNRAHFDLLYHLIAMIVVFEHLARQEMAQPMHHPVRAASAAGALMPVRVLHERGFKRHAVRHGFRNAALGS